MSKASSHPAAAKNRGIVWPTARRPAWISDEELDWLPADARQEAVELIASTYQELVVEAETALERAAGEEFVFLFWLGLLRSLRLRGHSRGCRESRGSLANTRIPGFLLRANATGPPLVDNVHESRHLSGDAPKITAAFVGGQPGPLHRICSVVVWGSTNP